MSEAIDSEQENDPVKSARKHLTPLKAIRQHCVMDCSNKHPGEVRKCKTADCRLFHLRMGRNPARQNIGPGAKNFRRTPDEKKVTQRTILKTRRPER